MSTCVCINGRQRAAAIGVLAAVAMLATMSTAFGQADVPRGGGCAPDCSPPKQNIECLNPSPQYDNRTFVGQLLLNGSPWCTAWIVASDGTESVVMTNQHCTAGQNVANMDVKFNYQCDACTNGAPEATQTFPVTGLITENAGLDYALLRVGGDPAATYGIAQVDSSTATVGMGIYEIHHAGGLVKGYDQGTVQGLNVSACVNNEIAVSSLVASGGASGSPIFRLDNHCVTAICNCGPPCQDGFGVPMSNIIPNAQPILQGAGFDFTMCGQGSVCPGTGDCCTANGTPGCNDAACCNAVCLIDPFCCDVSWDSVCAGEAAADGVNCPQCQACGTAGAGDCCSANGTPFCDNATCCDAICLIDAFCCATSWDSICAGEAAADPVNCPQCIPSIPNDDCANAIPIAPNSVTSGTTTGATLDNAPFCGTTNTAPGVWYSVIGTGTDITATTCELNCSGAAGANYDTKISIYQDGCGVLTCVTGNDDSCGGGSSSLLSTVTWCAEAGVKYLVLVHGFASATGDFVLELCKGAPCQGGACCLWDGSCVDVPSQVDCDALVGTYQGDGTDCATTNCPPPPTGANFFLDPVAFDAALAAAGKVSKVAWDFAPNNVPPGGVWVLDDPVNINSHAGAAGDPWAPPAFWPPEVDNVTFQANLGPHPAPPVPNPHGIDGVALANALAPFNNNILVANFFVDSLDIISGPPAGDNHTAMSLELVTTSGAAPVFVTVYDKTEQVVGVIKVNVAGGQKVFLGILMKGSFTIGRVNVWDPSGGAEGISAFTLYLPEPSPCGDPAAGNCFDPGGNGTPGCNNLACCEAVCAVDPFCCDFAWDGICASEAQDLCGNAACGPGAGNCFAPGGNGTPGCNNPVCCKKICLIDPFCCDTAWDSLCADEADQFCTSCLEDLDGNGVVGFFDLSLLLASWAAGTTLGDIGGPGGCGVPDGVTNFFDLSCLLSAWAAGACN